MDRNVLDYLPEYLQGYREIKALAGAQQYELEFMHDEADRVLRNQFVEDVDKAGAERYEALLGIVPREDATLEDRRFSILVRLNEQPPYTIRMLENNLRLLCGEGNYSLELYPNEYRLTVMVALIAVNNIIAVGEMLDRVLPANLDCWLTPMYNTHGLYKNKTHGEMKVWTHEQLRSEVH